MILTIGCLIWAALAWVFIARSIRRAPKDTDLWDLQTLLMDSDPETRVEILKRHSGLPEPGSAQTEPGTGRLREGA